MFAQTSSFHGLDCWAKGHAYNVYEVSRASESRLAVYWAVPPRNQSIGIGDAAHAGSDLTKARVLRERCASMARACQYRRMCRVRGLRSEP